jgi:hypothetical protein
MDTQRWNQLRQLFDRGIELPPHQWEDFLRGASDDAALRSDVAVLLRIDQTLRLRDARTDRGSKSTVAMAAHLACAPSDPRVGNLVGPWRILRMLGQGSGGVVYLAESASARDRVALKLPHPGEAVAMRERFRTERDVLLRLDLPGIVRLLDAQIDAAEPCLVLEHVEGRDVRRHCALHRLGPVTRMALFVQICDIVAEVHAGGVAHRDLRAENILVARDGSITLLDFGRATWLPAPDAYRHEADGEPTSPAASCDGSRAAMIACDVRALAVLLRELWTGPEFAPAGGISDAAGSALATVVARALDSGCGTLSELVDALRAALQAHEACGGNDTPPFRQALGDGVAPLLHCTLAKSARQSRRLFGGVEESPGSAGQSAR